MPISITCSACGKRLKAKDALAGRTAPCPACGAKLVIGSVDDTAAAMLLDDAALPPEPEAPPIPHDDAIDQPRVDKRPPSSPAVRRSEPRLKPVAKRETVALPPLTTKDPPIWLRHLHWLLILSLIPLAV